MSRFLLIISMLSCWLSVSGQCPAITNPVTLPFSEGFESYTGPNRHTTDTNFICTNSYSWRFEQATSTGLLIMDTTVGPSTHTGAKAAILSGGTGAAGTVNNLILTINMSSYDTLGGDIYLDFYFADMWDEADPEDRVWVRGNDGATWIEIYDWSTVNNTGNWQFVRVNVTDSMKANNQDFSATTQFRWGQNDNALYLGSSSGDGVGVDNIAITQPTCDVPSNLVTTSTAPGSVDFSWTTGGASNWQISYDTTGNPLGANLIGVATSAFTVNGLSEGVEYDFYVRDSCGPGDVSFWVGPVTAKVLCNSITAPYYNGFENDFLDQPPLCWEDYETTTNAFVEVEDFTGTAAPYAGDQALYLYSGSSSTTPGDDTLWAYTPRFSDLTAGDKQIRFFANSDAPQDELIIGTVPDLTPGATFTSIDTITFLTPDTYEEVIVPITVANGYNGTDEYIVLSHSLGVTTDYIRIDEFNYEVIPACPKITGISLVSVGTDTATFTFNSFGGTTFNVEFGPTGFNQGTGCTGTLNLSGGNITINNSTDPSCLVQLTSNTEYDIYIQNNCTAGGNGISAWEGPFTFKTKCNPFTAPYSQNFDGTIAPEIDGCWAVIASNATTIQTVTSTDHGEPIPSLPNALEINDVGATPFGMLISPEFTDLPSGANWVKVKIAYEGGGLGFNDTLFFGTMASQTDTFSFAPYDTILMENTNGEFVETIILLDNTALIGANTHVAFSYKVAGGGYEFFLDDFIYEPAPACLPPLPNTLGAVNVTGTGADLFWGAGSQGQKTFVEVGTPGFVPGTSSWVVRNSVPGSDDTASVSGLSAQTVYEFYVQDSCLSGGLSPWIGPFTFVTGCAFNPITLPFTEDFESYSGPISVDTTFICGGTFSWSFERTDPSSGDLFFDYTASQGPTPPFAGLQSAGIQTTSSNPAYLVLTVDMSNYASMIQAVELSFNFADHGDEANPEDRVWARGSTSDPWIEIYDWSALNSSNWEFVDIPLTFALTAANQTFSSSTQIRWGQQDDSDLDGGDGLGLDDVSLVVIACPKPTNLGTVGVLDTSANITWSGSSLNADYEVWFGPQGFYQGTLTTGGVRVLTGGSDTLLIDTLSPTTCYEFAVRGICGPGDTSDWVGAFSFCTPCAIITGPYLEDFENHTVGHFDSLDNCWSFNSDNPGTTPAGGFSWEVRNTPQTTSTNTGPAGDNTSYPATGGKWIHSDNSGGTVGNETRLTSPLIDISGIANPHLLYYFHNFAPPTSNFRQPLYVDVFDGVQWFNRVHDIDTVFQSADTDPWKDTLIDLNPYNTTGIVQVRFRSAITRDDGGAGDVSIDDVWIYDLTCPKPTGFTTSNLTSNSVDISWTSGGASHLLIEYGPPGFVPRTGSGTFATATTSPYTLTGLSPGTNYDIYIQDSCGVGDVSVRVGPAKILTPCVSALSGTYTIGPSGNYTSFNQAIDSLNICGISGPVIFNVAPGTYNENIVLVDIMGSSATNTITFDGSNASLVEITHTSAVDEPTIYFNGADHVIIKNMTVSNNSTGDGWGILLQNSSDSNTIDACHINMPITTTTDIIGIVTSSSLTAETGGGNNANYLTVSNCIIRGGETGVHLEGNTTSATHNLGHKIINNTFLQQDDHSIEVDGLTDLTIQGNDIDSLNNTGATAVRLEDVNDYNISENRVVSPDWALYILDGNDGFSPASNSRIVNNMLLSDADYGLYLNDFQSTEVYHNTSLGEPAFRMNDQDTVDIRNNIFVSTGDFAFESDDALDAIDVVDYNLYYSTGTDAFDIGTSVYTDLAAWQAGDAVRNVNSVEGDPVFVSPTDLHVLGSLADDAGDNTVGITIDIDGDTRPATGSTIVDMGADEFTSMLDLALISGDLLRDICLSNTDTAVVQVRNTVGGTVDFSVDPLTVNYDVAGPINTSGSVTVNTGTLPANDTIDVLIFNIDMSEPGTYTFNAYLDPNATNSVALNDTLFPSVSLVVDTPWTVDPQSITITNAVDSVEICVKTPFFSGGSAFFISEVCHYKFTNGAPVGGWGTYPYVTADDYIEITGVPGSDLGGITLEQWSTTAQMSTFTFAPGTVLSPNGTAIIAVGQMGASVESPSDFYYHGNGAFTGTFSSTGSNGRILKDASGNIIDAVAYGSTYTFPAASGVTPTDWSGTQPGSGNSSGIRLEGPDVNSSAGWVASVTSAQDPNTVNTGVIVPAAGSIQGFSWTLNGNLVDTLSCTYVGPFTTPGVYNYIASFTNRCGTFADTVVITVPSCFAPVSLSGSAVSGTSVGVSWDTTGLGSTTTFEIEYGPIGFIPGTGTSVTAPAGDDSTTITGLTTNLCQDYYIRSVCGPNSQSPWIGPVTICPEPTPCDDIDAYVANDNFDQSALFMPWQNGGAALFGDAAFSTTRFQSAPNSLWVNKIGATAPDADLVAYFDTISSGAWEVNFDIFVESGAGAYFNIQQNHAFTSGTNYWGAEIYFESNGTASVEYDNPLVQAGTFAYTQNQWNNISTVIDLDNDSIWIEFNGSSTGIGWAYSAANPTVPLQFNGVNFYSGVQTGQTYDINFYVDNFCVTSRAVCPPPTALQLDFTDCDSAVVSWTSASANNNTILEWGPSGFPLGSGTRVNSLSSPYTITGLSYNTPYDVYVADTCGATDTSSYVSITFTTDPLPVVEASFTFTQTRTGLNDANIDFDGSGSVGANSYSWDFGNGSTGTGVNDSSQYSGNGTYDVTLTVTGDCGVTDDTTITITVSGIDLTENPLERSLRVYPNPSDKVVTVDFNTLGQSSAIIRITDISGREMMHLEETAINGNTHSRKIDIEQLAPGTYIIEISTGDMTAYKKLSVR